MARVFMDKWQTCLAQMAQAEGKLLCLFVLPFNLYDISTKKRPLRGGNLGHRASERSCPLRSPCAEPGGSRSSNGHQGTVLYLPWEQTLF